jgi:hypothetical protein
MKRMVRLGWPWETSEGDSKAALRKGVPVALQIKCHRVDHSCSVTSLFTTRRSWQFRSRNRRADPQG